MFRTLRRWPSRTRTPGGELDGISNIKGAEDLRTERFVVSASRPVPAMGGFTSDYRFRRRADHDRLRGTVVPALQAGEEVPRRPPGPLHERRHRRAPRGHRPPQGAAGRRADHPHGRLRGRDPRGEPERRGAGRPHRPHPRGRTVRLRPRHHRRRARRAWRPRSTPPGKASTPSWSTPARSAARPGSATGSTTTRGSPTASPAPSWPSGSSPRPAATGSSSSRRCRSPPSSATATTW